LETADVSSQRLTQRFKLSRNYLLYVVRSWLVIYNDPAFTSVSLELWSDRSGSPGVLIASSDPVLKSAIIQDQNGAKEVPFTFLSEGVPLRGGDWYHLVLSASGYTGIESSHIGWMKAFPEEAFYPTYQATFENLSVAPYRMVFVGSKIR
jgi:hypothetical protein